MKLPFSISVLFLLLIVGCKSTQHLNDCNISGLYAWGIYHEEGSNLKYHLKNLNLHEDSSFNYKSTEGITHSESRGIWHYNGKYIYLNSEPNLIDVNQSINDTTTFLVSKAELTNSDLTTVRIIYQDSTPQRFATCEVKFKKTYQSYEEDETGTFYFTLSPVERIIIIAPGMNAIEYCNRDLKANKFEFIMFPRKVIYEHFENKELKIQRGRLYDKSILKNNWIKKDYYRKIEKDKTPVGNTG
jgi:hypothetical protein